MRKSLRRCVRGGECDTYVIYGCIPISLVTFLATTDLYIIYFFPVCRPRASILYEEHVGNSDVLFFLIETVGFVSAAAAAASWTDVCQGLTAGIIIKPLIYVSVYSRVYVRHIIRVYIIHDVYNSVYSRNSIPLQRPGIIIITATPPIEKPTKKWYRVQYIIRR